MRVLIYNGDVDACIPYNGNEGVYGWSVFRFCCLLNQFVCWPSLLVCVVAVEWTSGLGIPLKEDWRAWTVNSQVGGYVTTYDKGFMFATVKGSGIARQDESAVTPIEVWLTHVCYRSHGAPVPPCPSSAPV